MAKDFNRDGSNALVRQILSDPARAGLYWHNVKEAAAKSRSMEDWARDGFIANPSRNHDLREEDLL